MDLMKGVEKAASQKNSVAICAHQPGIPLQAAGGHEGRDDLRGQ